MQLIDTDKDKGVQVKMSTIQQESLEKFSLIPTMCDDIMSEISGNDESSRNEDAFEESNEKVDVDEYIAQHNAISHESIRNEKKCKHNGLTGKVDEELADSKPEEYQNTHIVDKEEKNCDIVNKSVMSNKEKIELEISCVNNLEKIHSNDIEKRNDALPPTTIINDKSAIDKAEDESVNDTNMEDFKTTNDIVEKIENPPEENIEMQVSIEEFEKVTGNETKDRSPNENKERSNLEDKMNTHIEEDIEINIIKEQDKVKLLPEQSPEGNQNEENIAMDVSLEEHDTEICGVAVVGVSKYTIGDKIEDDIQMDITLEEKNKMNIKVTENEITLNYTEDNTEVNKNEENIVMHVSLEEHDEQYKIDKETSYSSKKEDQIGEKVEDDIEIGETLEVTDKVNTRVTEDKIMEEIKESNETGQKSEKQIEEDIGVNVTLKDQNKITSRIDDLTDVNIKKNSEIRDKNEDSMIMEISFEDHHKDDSSITEDIIEKQIGKDIEILKSLEEQNKVNTRIEESTEISATNDEIISHKQYNNEMNVTIEEQDKEKNSVTENSIKEDTIEGKEFEGNDNVLDELKGFVRETHDKLEEQEITENDEKDKLQLENETSEIHVEQAEENFVAADGQKEQNSKVKKNIEDQEKGENKLQDNVEKEPNFEINETKDIVVNLDEENSGKNKQQINKEDSEIEKNDEFSEEIPQVVKLTDENEIADEKMIEDTKNKLNFKDNENISNSEVSDIRMDCDEIINITDEKDEEIIERQPENAEKTIVSIEKSDSGLSDVQEKSDSGLSNVQEIKNLDTDEVNKSASELPVRDSNVQSQTKEKKKLTHISKLSNTLDILSDEEDDQPKDPPQKEAGSEIQCMSINVDDDDDVMLIDEEPSTNDEEKKTDVVAEPEPEKTEDIEMKESKMESEKKDQQSHEIIENETDITPSDVAAPCIEEKKSSEPEQESKQDEVPVPTKPLVYGNFLKTYKKNLADMTRDDLEEFCTLKIVEGVVDRSQLSEVKSQLKALAQNIEEYKKKAAILSKQNRDLQVVIKSVQEEQKKKTNMAITPLRITRSVGVQVLMNDDKLPARRKTQGANNNAANGATNRQGKAAQNQNKQKVTATTNNTAAIPVPRLVPAVNNSNLNTVKAQSPSANTPAKPQSAPANNSPVQAVSNGVPASPAQRPEKRPLIRMQQSNSFTVDLTDDEPPAKVVTRNAAAPVRLVPPQNLLAPNRQPFVANVSSPRKVYIPISGSQSQVAGVRPGQTIMLRAISPQSPRQRLVTPTAAKPNASSSPIRMQRVPNRHPAPLPDSVKQYQPLNWKALPPAPELKLSKVDNGIVISWTIHGYQEENYEEIASYQLYAYQETSSPPSTTLWKKIGDVKALPLPMACTLTQFMAGYKYYFAVRAVDIRSRLGPFSLPGSILLLNKV